MLPYTFVTGDLAGNLDSPLYGMFDIAGQLHDKTFEASRPLEQFYINQPSNPYSYSVKWDGEWQITYETFRDMGIAYGVGIILIYLLVVAQFRSYVVPLIIMVPIPLTIIGVMPGHAIFNVLMGSQFTATSMIGMIALAGIIVRNSILLVDFINEQIKAGVDLQEAVIRSGAVRSKPIILTGLAAMLGAFFILDDPIFNGLAISLIFGIMTSTVLTLFVIPILYYSYSNYTASKQ
jgi:multidrug efflux pump subunit AcrB